MSEQLKYHNINRQKRIDSLKTEFRRIQRQNIHILNQKEILTFENFARKSDKKCFWKYIKKKKKKHSNDKSPTISPQKLLSNYSNFFFEKNYQLSVKQKEISSQIEKMHME